MLRECRVSGLRELLRKSSERDQQIELRALQRILGDGRLRLDVTRLPLRVKHFDVGGCAFTKRNIGDLHDLVRTVGGELRLGKRARGRRDSIACGANLGRSLPLEVRAFELDGVQIRQALSGLSGPKAAVKERYRKEDLRTPRKRIGENAGGSSTDGVNTPFSDGKRSFHESLNTR